MATSLRIITGTRYKTATSRCFTVIRRFKKLGSGTRMLVMVEIKWDGEDKTFEITRRHFNKMATGYAPRTPEPEQGEPEQEQDTQPNEAPVADSTPPRFDVGLAQAIAIAVAPHVKAGVDRDTVERIVDERIVGTLLPRRIEVVVPGSGDVKDLGIQHSYFDAIRRCVAARLTVWLVGPAGSGKTTMAAALAESLGLKDYSTSVCLTTSKADLMGFKNAGTGEYVGTDLRTAYEHGGLFLLDEVDAGNPNVMVVANALLANDRVGFADGMVKRHPDFICVTGANTIGMGADKQFVGRNKLDEATRDRFIVFNLPYDPAITAAMCGVCPTAFAEAAGPKPFEFIQVEDKADAENDKHLKSETERRCFEFIKRTVRIQNAIERLKVRHILGPRTQKSGCTMIRLGFKIEDVMDIAVWKGLDADTVRKIESNA
jgi:MoxR-like ATPase